MNGQKLPRYSFAGDEYLFVEMSYDMNLPMNFRIQTICKSIMEEAIPGVIEAYPGNATYLIHYQPEVVSPEGLLKRIQKVESEATELTPFDSHLIEIPVLYNDPWTVACAKEFASSHQDPSVTNLEFVARINGMVVSEFIKAHTRSQYLVTMKRFLPGSYCLVHMVDRGNTLSCPKYLVPRAWSPVRSLVMGGIFTNISPYDRSPGGYQLLGRSAVPVHDPEKKLIDLKVSLANTGDRFKLKSIDMEEYQQIRANVEAGDYRFKRVKQKFDPLRALMEPETYLALLEAELRDV